MRSGDAIRVLRVTDTADAVAVIADGSAQIVVTDAIHGPPLRARLPA